MRNGLGLLAVAWVSLTGCSAPSTADRCAEPTAVSAPEAVTAPTHGSPGSRVFVVRHAEKADDGTKDPPLLPEGTARAACLAQTLRDVALTHVFATDLQRTELTVLPTATAHGLQVVTLPASDTEALVEALRKLPAGSVALVAGHSNTIPSVAELLGAPLEKLDAKGHVPEREHDRLIELVLAEGGESAPVTQLRYCAPSPRS